MKLSKKLAALAAVGLVAGVLLAVSSNAANANTGDCKVTVSTLIHHPDEGNGHPNPWALDHFTRTVTICEGAQVVDPTPTANIKASDVAIGLSYYKATVEDTGTFVTNPGAHLSPARGENLVGDLPGTFSGHFTVYFIAVDNFGNYKHVFDGGTYAGTDPASTPDFVAKDWGGSDFYPTNAQGQPTEGSGFEAKTATWTYKTWCGDKVNEQWVDAGNNDWGTDEPGAGDITGATECPSPSPTPSATTASPTPTPSPTTTVAPTPSPVTQTVTVTG